jgi:hypothetical protein
MASTIRTAFEPITQYLTIRNRGTFNAIGIPGSVDLRQGFAKADPSSRFVGHVAAVAVVAQAFYAAPARTRFVVDDEPMPLGVLNNRIAVTGADAPQARREAAHERRRALPPKQ